MALDFGFTSMPTVRLLRRSAVFIAAITSVLLRPGIDTKCGCFGKFEWPCGETVGVCQLFRDLVMLAMAVFLMVKGPGPLAIDRESTK